MDCIKQKREIGLIFQIRSFCGSHTIRRFENSIWIGKEVTNCKCFNFYAADEKKRQVQTTPHERRKKILL